MSARDYMKKAESCLNAAEKLRDPAERAALVLVAACYTKLADYVSVRQEHSTAHRAEDQPNMHTDS